MRFKIVAISITGCLLAVLVAFTAIIKKQDSRRDRKYRELQEKTIDLEVECRNIEKEIDELQVEADNRTSSKATTHIVFTELNEKVYEECFPVMEKYEYTGTLAVSSEQLPGKKGCITVKQYQKMVEAGWKVCISWESAKDVEKWWKDLQKDLEELEVNYEKVIYFPQGTYEKKIDDKLKTWGFEVVIAEKADLDSPLQKVYEDGIWHIYGMGSMTEQPKKWLKEAVVEKANVIYLVGFELEHQRYDENSFTRMLNSFEECVIAKELIVCDIMEAKEHYRVLQSGDLDEVKETYKSEIKKLEKQLNEKREKVEELYEQY